MRKKSFLFKIGSNIINLNSYHAYKMFSFWKNVKQSSTRNWAYQGRA